jgi:hypothetical protein
MFFRATITGQTLVLTELRPQMIAPATLREVIKRSLPAGVALADIEIDTRDGSDQTEPTIQFIAGDSPEARERLTQWASHVGHKRLWFEDQVVDVARLDNVLAEFETTCLGCGWYRKNSGYSFMWHAQDEGVFPINCNVCGAALPQWTPCESGAGNADGGSSTDTDDLSPESVSSDAARPEES